MPRYVIALNQTTDVNGFVSVSLKPAAGSGIAVSGFYYAGVETAAFGTRARLGRYSADGTGGSTQTPSLMSSRSAAATAAGHNDYNATDPTLAGNYIIVAGMVEGTAMLRARRWSIPNPRYPITAEPSGDIFGVDSTSQLITVTSRIHFSEPYPDRNDFATMRGRRSRRPGYQAYASASGNFEGLSTAPKNGGDGHSHNYVQGADWPVSVFNLAGQMNLLLSGGAVAEQGTGDIQSVSTTTVAVINGQLIVGSSIASVSTTAITEPIRNQPATGSIASVSTTSITDPVRAQFATGTIVSVSSTTVAAVNGQLVTGAIASVSTTTVAEKEGLNVTGTIASVSSTAVAEKQGLQVSGTIASVSSTTVAEREGLNVTGTIASVSTISGDATVGAGGGSNQNATGDIQSVSATTVAVKSNQIVTGTIASVSSTTVTVIRDQPGTGSIISVSATSITVIAGYQITGAITSTSTVSGDATASGGTSTVIINNYRPGLRVIEIGRAERARRAAETSARMTYGIV